MAKFKLGDRIKIDVTTKAGKRRAAVPEPALRYGPLVRLEDDTTPTRRGNLEIILGNALVPFVVCPVTGSHSLFLMKAFNALTDQSQAAYTNGPADLVRANYREAATRYGSAVMAIPYAHAGDYGLRVNLGGTPFAIDTPDSNWRARKTPTEVRDRLVAYDAAHGTDHSSQIAALEVQIAEWAEPLDLSGASTSTVNMWWTPLNDWFRAYGTLAGLARFRQGKIKWNIEITGAIEIFEAFDPFDVTNFKVTGGAFDDPEIAPPTLNGKGRRKLFVYLVPKLWSYEASGTEWAFRYGAGGPSTNAVEKRTYTQAGLMYALSAPLMTARALDIAPASENDLDRTLTFRTPIAGSGSPPTFAPGASVGTEDITVSGMVNLQSGYAPDSDYSDPEINTFKLWAAGSFVTGGLGIPRGAGYGDFNDTEYSSPFPEALGEVTALLELSDCAVTVKVAATPAGQLAAIVMSGEQIFYVYRRTTAGEGATVYSGPYDGVVGTSALINVSDDSYFPPTDTFPGFPTTNPVSAARDFAYFDPDGLWLHESY